MITPKARKFLERALENPDDFYIEGVTEGITKDYHCVVYEFGSLEKKLEVNGKKMDKEGWN